MRTHVVIFKNERYDRYAIARRNDDNSFDFSEYCPHDGFRLRSWKEDYSSSGESFNDRYEIMADVIVK